MTNEEYSDSLAQDFASRHKVKFMAGAVKHGGNLWEKPEILSELENEVLDQWSYVSTIRFQLKEVANILERARLEESVADIHRAEILIKRLLE